VRRGTGRGLQASPARPGPTGLPRVGAVEVLSQGHDRRLRERLSDGARDRRRGRLKQGGFMGFEQYHEPAAELPQETRTFARIIVSLTEEAEAINWYQQRMALEKDGTARAIMANSQQEEFKHF